MNLYVAAAFPQLDGFVLIRFTAVKLALPANLLSHTGRPGETKNIRANFHRLFIHRARHLANLPLGPIA